MSKSGLGMAERMCCDAEICRMVSRPRLRQHRLRPDHGAAAGPGSTTMGLPEEGLHALGEDAHERCR